ncbi:MAG: hypothetical protein QOF21_504 [Actinomycetota bacterium]
MNEPGVLGRREVVEPGWVVFGVVAHRPPVPVLQADAALSLRARIAETGFAWSEGNEPSQRFPRSRVPSACPLDQAAGIQRADSPAHRLELGGSGTPAVNVLGDYLDGKSVGVRVDDVEYCSLDVSETTTHKCC